MLEILKKSLTSDTAQWYETLPFIVGFAFVLIELPVRALKGRRPFIHAASLGYMLSEGIAICIMPIYVFSLAFDRALAASIAEKNGKALAVAMLVSFATLLAHVVNGWLSDDAAYANYAETKNASPQYSE